MKKLYMESESKANRVFSATESEAEASRFNSKLNHKPWELHFRNLFSEVLSDRKFVWDLHVRYPFKISKEDDARLREEIQKLFNNTFLNKG